ncbi:MAG: N-acetylmuramoyl-L-alanine amidase [Bacteroidales bacterium]|nr:N-acetylmuramoyl-L-alanine amidase [Bacteroidales bacterium]
MKTSRSLNNELINRNIMKFSYKSFKFTSKTKQKKLSVNKGKQAMSRNIFQITILLVLFTFLIQGLVSAQKSDYHIRKVVIDPGHGGKDPGAVGKISKEKDLVLAISLKLGELIETNHKDVEVIYTRDTDKFVELHKRAALANEVEADMFISVHVNAISGVNAYGAETFAMGLHVSEENLRVAKLENSVVLQEDNYEDNYQGFDPTSPESHIIFSLYQNAYLERSLSLAQKMQYYFKTEAKRYDRGVKQAGFLVLWRTSMPSILVECGFISNPEEERFMNTTEGQEKLANAIYYAFRDYKTAYENQGKEIGANNDDEQNTTNNYQTDETHINNTIEENTTEQSQDIEKDINEQLVSPAARIYSIEDIPEGVIFGVQIKSSQNKLQENDNIFELNKDIYMYFHNGLYKYFVGATNSYDDIIKLQNDLRNTYNDCFIIAFKNGQRITIKQAKKELN